MKYKLKTNEIIALNINTNFSICKKFKVKIKKKTINYLICGIFDGVLILFFPMISNYILQDKFLLFLVCFPPLLIIWSAILLLIHLILLFPEIYA